MTPSRAVRWAMPLTEPTLETVATGRKSRSGVFLGLCAGPSRNRFDGYCAGARGTHILSVELGHLDSRGEWVHELWLNGDETGANNTARIPPFSRNSFLGVDRPMILRVRLYEHD